MDKATAVVVEINENGTHVHNISLSNMLRSHCYRVRWKQVMSSYKV